MDVMHTITNWIDHNRWTAMGLVIIIAIAAAVVGCNPTTVSLLNPAEKVTAAQLEREAAVLQAQLDTRHAGIQSQKFAYEAEVTAAQNKLEIARGDIAEQIEFRRNVIETVAGIGTAISQGEISLPAIIGGLTQLALAGIATGVVLDNRRKNAIIAKADATPPPTTP